MFDTIPGILMESWQVLNAFAVYCLIGLCMSGFLKSIMPDALVERHLGGNDFRSVVKAALLGIPLPLCSCGVMPVAAGLRRQGAGNGPTTAFLIATPETGVDSIAVTYALLDPLMTVIRPVAAFFTALTAGALVSRLPEYTSPQELVARDRETCRCCPSDGPARTCCERHSGHGRIRAGLRFAFNDLLADIGPALLAGVLIAGAISFFLPENFIMRHLGNGPQQMLVMLLIGIPLYVCATASTPVAAALALKGLSPGAALVFLLAGPATNAATILIVSRLMGARVAAVCVGVIAGVSLGLGMLTNALYGALGRGITGWTAAAQHTDGGWVAAAAATLLLAAIVRARFARPR